MSKFRARLESSLFDEEIYETEVNQKTCEGTQSQLWFYQLKV